jgi:hypothetical protein
MEISMKSKPCPVIAIASVVMLAACAGQPETYTPTNAAPVTMPKGTIIGGSPVGHADAITQLGVEGNNNAMNQFDKLNGDGSNTQVTDNQGLQNYSKRSRSSSSARISRAPAKSFYFSPGPQLSSTRSSSD